MTDADDDFEDDDSDFETTLCPSCHGYGDDDCPECDGEGVVCDECGNSQCVWEQQCVIDDINARLAREEERLAKIRAEHERLQAISGPAYLHSGGRLAVTNANGGVDVYRVCIEGPWEKK
jgi:RecJ-like exonuclease|tara:strand:+ start:16120 stop:16479 length:360 start_codon:yes stop_codon:yes gene_type:complete